MWGVRQPKFRLGESYELSAKLMRKNMQEKFLKIGGTLTQREAEYQRHAKNGDIHLIKRENELKPITRHNFKQLYNKMTSKKHRKQVYNKIKTAAGGVCPFCKANQSNSIDHILPQSKYAIFSVSSCNLVFCCKDCNNKKGSNHPKTQSDSFFHPYFEDVNSQQWLFAKVEGEFLPPVFYVKPVKGWAKKLNRRISHQFEVLRLNDTYQNAAFNELKSRREDFSQFNAYRPHIIRASLNNTIWKLSQSPGKLNSWETALYQALLKSEWFCNIGFSKI